MSKKSKKTKDQHTSQGEHSRQTSGSTGTPKGAAGSRGRLVIGLVGVALACIFLASFIYRSNNQGLKVQRQTSGMNQAQQGQNGMSGAMQEAVMGEIGKMMEQLKENPNDQKLLLDLADRFAVLKSWDRVEMFLRRAMVQEPGNADILYRLGTVSFNLDKHTEAAEYFEQVTALEPEHALAHMNLGILYKHYLDDPAKGASYFQTVLTLPEAPEEMREAAQEELGSEAPSKAQAAPELEEKPDTAAQDTAAPAMQHETAAESGAPASENDRPASQ